MKRFALSLILLLLAFEALAQSSSSSSPQTNDQRELERIKREDFTKMKKHIQKQLEERNSYLKKYFHGSLFENFEKNFERMFDNFDPEMSKKLEQLFGGDDFSGFDRLFQDAYLNPNMMPDTHQWKETPEGHILTLKIKVAENTPLDIKITKEKVTIKATVVEEAKSTQNGVKRHSIRQYQLNRVFPIPVGCDPDKAKFKNIEGQIIITFPKKAPGSKSLKKGKGPIQPLKPSKKDRTI
ncbi:MAG: Hsp20/alpha crystallin family protein [Halobacteriovoraceae bacterium]|jgi:HSP20 family molecular chaperone IbpA|nr:Hsp20/alpha crystallin family protein [Halobacteriovoraceae bacterium]